MNKLFKQAFMLMLAISLLVPTLPMGASANTTSTEEARGLFFDGTSYANLGGILPESYTKEAWV